MQYLKISDIVSPERVTYNGRRLASTGSTSPDYIELILVKELMLMSVTLIELIGLLLAVLTAGIAIGRFVEKINRHISDSKKDRHSAKK